LYKLELASQQLYKKLAIITLEWQCRLATTRWSHSAES
jgi:hypothetical protein